MPGAVGGYAAHKIFNGQRGWTWAGAVGSSLVAGLVKETDRSRNGEWQTDDVLYTTLGGIISGLTVDLLLKNNKRRGSRRRGKNCGCLIVYYPSTNFGAFMGFAENGSWDLGTAMQASYLMDRGL
ncbi:hypothetical protein [Maribacter sp. 2304DJ31-5]|uniref:hypothetical protein n=1 Tax=Maribacter sp. 2304DJ31-5 TaxID=3386273 RepID=UPI0039BD52D2